MENAPHALLSPRNRNPGIINGTFDMDFAFKLVFPFQCLKIVDESCYNLFTELFFFIIMAKMKLSN